MVLGKMHFARSNTVFVRCTCITDVFIIAYKVHSFKAYRCSEGLMRSTVAAYRCSERLMRSTVAAIFLMF